MQFTHLFALAAAVCVARARLLRFNDNHMPIKFIETSYGQAENERVEYLEAQIQPHHLTSRAKLDFTTTVFLNGCYNQARAVDDDPGYLVGPQFSGPADWYNLSPQNARANRNKDYQAITPEWYAAECQVRSFLNKGGDRYVNWKLTMIYVRDSNRPDHYILQVDFIQSETIVSPGMSLRINNPFRSNDNSAWDCNTCCSNNQDSQQCSRVQT